MKEVVVEHALAVTYHPTWLDGVLVVSLCHDNTLCALDPMTLKKITTLDIKQHITRITSLTAVEGHDNVNINTGASTCTETQQHLLAVCGGIHGALSPGKDITAGVAVLTTSGNIIYKWSLPTNCIPECIAGTKDGHLAVSNRSR